MADKKCPFCDLDAARIYAENDVAAAIPDAFPIAEGHTLVILKRHTTVGSMRAEMASTGEISQLERGTAAC